MQSTVIPLLIVQGCCGDITAKSTMTERLVKFRNGREWLPLDIIWKLMYIINNILYTFLIILY